MPRPRQPVLAVALFLVLFILTLTTATIAWSQSDRSVSASEDGPRRLSQSAPLAGDCLDLIINPSFETNEAWHIPDTFHPAGYTMDQSRSGQRSMRTGIPPGGSQIRSYSSFNQAITLPAGATTATLRLWTYPLSEEASASSQPRRLSPDRPGQGDRADERLLAADAQYVLILDEDDAIEQTLLWQKSNAARWQMAIYDLTPYLGRTIKPHAGTFNDGLNGLTAMYVDDVTVEICTDVSPLPDFRDFLPLILRGSPTEPQTPTPTPSPLPAAAPLVLRGYQATQLVGSRYSSTLYAFAGNLLHRSDDNGITWRQVSGLRPVDNIVMSPAAPDWLWSGQGYPCYVGGGDVPLYRSTNGGLSWSSLPAGVNLKPLLAHPYDRNRILARGCDGPYLSTDGGETWTWLPDRSPGNLWGIYLVEALVAQGEDWRTIYAAGVSEGGRGAVIKSTDGGTTWTRSTPLDPQPEIWWITDLEDDWQDPDLVRFLDPHTPWWTVDGGQDWQWGWTGLHDVVYNPGGPPDQSYGLYDLAIAPNDRSTLYLGTIRGLYGSPDGGLNWYQLDGYAWDQVPVWRLLVTRTRPGYLWLTTESGVFGLWLDTVSPLPTLTPTATATYTPSPTASQTPTATTKPAP